MDGTLPQRVLVVLHIYYGQMWTLLARCVENIRAECKCSVIVTISDKMVGNVDSLRLEVLTCFPDARIMIFENRGYDVGPFFEVLNDVDLDNYDYVVKLHTKRNIHGMRNGWINGFHLSGSKWRKALLGFCSSRKSFRSSLRRLEIDKTAGMVSSSEIIVPSDDYYERMVYPEGTRRALKIAGIKEGFFVAGTMFMVRAGLLKKLQGQWHLDDFPFVTHERVSEDDVLLPFVLERLLGYMVCAQGFKLADYKRRRPFFGIVHFLSSRMACALRFMCHMTIR